MKWFKRNDILKEEKEINMSTRILFGDLLTLTLRGLPVLKTENTAIGIRHADHVAPSIRKS
jgi:hypothetical protein